MAQSPTVLAILNIKSKICDAYDYGEPPLRDYKIGLNNVRHLIYASAEVHSDCLDKGSCPTSEAIQCAKIMGISKDGFGQLIGQKLGGCGLPLNVFPLNTKNDTSAWSAAEQTVYDHVKQGNGRYARLEYGIEYSDEYEAEVCRPSKIHYHFDLFENNGAAVRTIDGTFENISPRFTHDDFYYKGFFVRCPE